MTEKRPIIATLMVGMVLLLGGANAVAAVHGLTNSSLYLSLNTTSLLWVRVGVAALWAIIWVVAAIGLWLWRGWARTLTIAAFWVYALTRTSLWATNAITIYEQGRWFVVALFHIIAALCVSFILTRPALTQTDRPTQ